MDFRRQCRAPLLDRFAPHFFPETFYFAFSVVFDQLDKQKKAFIFLESLNGYMEKQKGGGILTRQNIFAIRGDGYFDITETSLYNNHHVCPRSRDERPKIKKVDQLIKTPVKFHGCWHIIFNNLYDDETIDFLDKLFFISKKREKGISFLELESMIESSRNKKAKSRV